LGYGQILEKKGTFEALKIKGLDFNKTKNESIKTITGKVEGRRPTILAYHGHICLRGEPKWEAMF
jgi:hypothetical protein